jgi:multiple sugar transport system permease protein/raffinose/stachyose/melibiose transport system permease protein
MKEKISKLLLNIVLTIVGVVTVLPFIWMVFSSFKQNSEITALEQTIIPKAFTFENYTSIQETFDFASLFGNSLFIAISTTVLVIYTSAISGFVLSKYKFKGSNLLFSFIISTMMVP